MTQNIAPDNNLSLLPCRFDGKPARRFRRKLDTGRSITTGLLLKDEAGTIYLRKELSANHHVAVGDDTPCLPRRGGRSIPLVTAEP